MRRAFFRSVLFQTLFVGLTALACVALLPTLILPRPYYMSTVHFFVRMVYVLERLVLGLRYEVRGLEHVPESGSFVLAAKHQSAYETMKLRLLFKDPAIILKRELLSIPLWGAYLAKSGPIAIDRSSPAAASGSITAGALRIQSEGRPIVIFPQGTRVDVGVRRPYKSGVAKIQEATGLAIVPMALNAGVFWPRKGFLKSSGTVVFEFLPALEAGLEREDLMSKLEERLESSSDALAAEALSQSRNRKTPLGLVAAGIVAIVMLVFGGYTALWLHVAARVQAEYPRIVSVYDASGEAAQIVPQISGFPGPVRGYVAEQRLEVENGWVKLQDLEGEAWPFPGNALRLKAKRLEAKSEGWAKALVFEGVQGDFLMQDHVVRVQDSIGKLGDFEIQIRGMVTLKTPQFPEIALDIALKNGGVLVDALVEAEALEAQKGRLLGDGLDTLAGEDGIVHIPVRQRGEMLYAGFFPIMPVPQTAVIANPRRVRPAIPATLPASASGLDNPPAPSP